MEKKEIKQEINLIFFNIRSALNVGAMFRTAEAAGVSKIYIVGYTPAPTDRFGKVNKDIAKAALGAEVLVSWENKKSLPALIKKLKKERFSIVALEQDENSIDYKKVKTGNRVAIIPGNEVTGLPKNILKSCNLIAEIPMQGKKESLNISVALGVALFRIFDL